MRTTSGRVRRTASTACAPSATEATTSIPSAARIIPKPLRTSAWSTAPGLRSRKFSMLRMPDW